jgi:glucose/mannose-6-phosphate isomerase
MEQAVKNFSKQFSFDPEIKNISALQKKNCFIVSGVGGSALSADLLKVWDPKIELIVHRNFGLPMIAEHRIKEYLFIASSYSGNTEEVLDGLFEALKRGMAVAIVAKGGKLIEEAKAKNLPYIELVDYEIPTRLALGLSAKAILKLMGETAGFDELSSIKDLDPMAQKEAGRELSKSLTGHIPMIYASQKNMPLAYAWKIQFNEISKTPAFANRFPELGHNEINGFDGSGMAGELAKKFCFVFLRDLSDDPRIQKRMEAIQGILTERGLRFKVVELKGNGFNKIFSSLLLADWSAYDMANSYGNNKDAVSVVDKLKKTN